MADGIHPDREDGGLSARQLVLMFLSGVAVCAVFFAAGFLVGYNERASRAAPSTERVTPSTVIPPTVNPPLASQPGAEKPAENPPATAPSVSEQEVPSAPAQAAAAPSGVVEGPLWIQVAASNSRQDAARIASALKSKGYPATVESPRAAGASDNLYRVQVGPFISRAEAEQVRVRLSGEGFKQPFIKH